MVQTIVWILLGILSRILPHPSDMTALTSLSLLAGMQFSQTRAIAIVLTALIGSDLTLAYMEGYPVWGNWTWFTYSGYIFIILMSVKINNDTKPFLLSYLISMTLFYWIWTNWGTWLLSGIYPHTLTGLASCFTAALPFLRNSLAGDMIWMCVLLGVRKTIGWRRATHFQQSGGLRSSN